MISWREFVREVQLKDKISYKEAMTRASVLWKKKPQHEKKTKMKNPKMKSVPEISQFPKNLRFKKKNPKVYTNTSHIKRKIPNILTMDSTRKRRKPNDSGPIDDHRFRYLNTGTNYIEV